MRIKTQAILIDEETYPIAVACLPPGFSTYPFDNVKGYMLVINVPGGYDRNAFDGDSFSVVGVHNLWIHPDEFAAKYKLINQKPGRKPEGAYWAEVELALDKELKERLEGTDEEATTISRTNVDYGRRLRKPRRFVAGYDG